MPRGKKAVEEVKTEVEAAAKKTRSRAKKVAEEVKADVKATEAKVEKAAKTTAAKTKATTKKVAEEVKADVKAVEKKVTAKKPTAKKAPKNEVIIQSPMGGAITPAEVLAKVGPVDQVYVRVDENKLYWVKGEETGSVDIW